MADNHQLSFDLLGESTLKVHLRGTWRLRGGLPSAAQLAELWARWIVSDSAKKPLVVKESFLSQQARDKSTEGSVAAMSEAVSGLSKEIAAAVGDLRSGRASETSFGPQ